MKTERVNSKRIDLALFLLRVVLAVIFIFHGGGKLFGLFGGPGIAGAAGMMAGLGIPFPTASATLVGTVEFLGGIALLAGVAVRYVSIPLLITMITAMVTAHSGFHFMKGGIEHPLTVAVILSALIFTGAGKYTVKNLLQTSKAST